MEVSGDRAVPPAVRHAVVRDLLPAAVRVVSAWLARRPVVEMLS